MGKVIQFPVKKIQPTPVDSNNQPSTSREVNKNGGWYFADLDESDTATILRALSYIAGIIFGGGFVSGGAVPWVLRGIFVTAIFFVISYLIVLRRK